VGSVIEPGVTPEKGILVKLKSKAIEELVLSGRLVSVQAESV